MPTFSWSPPFVSYTAAIPEPTGAASDVTHNIGPSEVLIPSKPILPDYVLKYAPILYINKNEKYFPGNPVDHLTHLTPRKLDGSIVSVPDEHKGKVSMLSLPQVNRSDVFLTMDDVRKNTKLPQLLSSVGKPNAEGRTTSPAFILFMDKTTEEGGSETTIDAFYFYFYPYNLGNTVVFKHWGNHVGDWEHSMIRFKNGQPQAIHLSAHADGNAWPFELLPKKDGRPIIYCASGSHANYPTRGTHSYSPVPLVGPKDYTSAGFAWDPTLSFVCAEVQPDITFKYAESSHPGHTGQAF